MAEYQWLAGLGGPDTGAWRQDFSRMGFALTALLLLPQVVYIGLDALARAVAPGAAESGILPWVMTVAAQYLVGFPAAMLGLGRSPRPSGGGEGPLRPARLLLLLVMCLGVMYVSSLAGNMVLELIAALKGSPVTNPVDSMNNLYPAPLMVLTVCVLAPVFEELFFRRLLLDRLRPYGARFAVTASALAFGMLHGNLSQLPYAFTLGLLLGWLALRSHRVWQIIVLHAVINLVGSGFLFTALGQAGDILMGLMVLVCMIAGGVLLFHYRNAFRLTAGPAGVSEGKKWSLWFLNPGMLCFSLFTLVFVALYLAV